MQAARTSEASLIGRGVTDNSDGMSVKLHVVRSGMLIDSLPRTVGA